MNILAAIERAEILLLARMQRRTQKTELDFIDQLKRIYVIDAVQRIYIEYRDKLEKGAWFSKVVLRSLITEQYETGENVDYLFDDFMDKLNLAEQNAIKRYVTKIQKIHISNIHEVKKNWLKQIEAIDNVFNVPVAKKRLKELLGDKHFRILMLYINSEKSILDCALLVAKSKVLIDKHDISVLRLSKMTLKSLKKYDSNKLKEVSSNGGLSEEDIDFIIEETEDKPVTPSSKIGKKSAITPETHPEYFTFEKPYKLLWKPIPKDAIDLVITEPKLNPKTDKWSYYAKYTNPKSGAPVTTYLDEHRQYNDESKFKAIRDFDKKGYDNVIKKNKTNLKSKNKDIQVLALVVELVHAGQFRIGNSKSEKFGVLGLHNLQVKNVKQNGNRLTFDYIAKKQMRDTITIECSDLVIDIFKRLTASKKPNDYIFTDSKGNKISENAVNKYLRENLNAPDKISIHKFRHVATSRMFRNKIVNGTPSDWEDLSFEEKVDWYKDQLESIRRAIRHDTIKTTLDSYIDPKLVSVFNKDNGFENISITAKNPKAKNPKARKPKRPQRIPRTKPDETKPNETKPTFRKITNVKKNLSNRKNKQEEIKEKIAKQPKKLTVRLKSKNKTTDIDFYNDELDELERELDDLLSTSSVLLAEARATAKILAWINDYNIRDRVIVEVDRRFYIGTITAKRNKIIYVTLDNGNKEKLRENSKFIKGKGKNKVRKSAIPLQDLDKWVSTEGLKPKPRTPRIPRVPRTPRVPRSNETSPTFRQVRDFSSTIEKLEQQLRNATTPEQKKKIREKLTIVKNKKKNRFEKEQANKEKELLRQKKIAKREAERLRQEQNRQEKQLRREAKEEAKRLRVIEREKKRKVNEQKNIEKLKKKAAKEARKLREQQEVIIRRRKKDEIRIERLKKEQKAADKILKGIKKPVSRIRKRPSIKTVDDTYRKSFERKPPKPKTPRTKRKKIITDVIQILGKQLTKIPELFKDRDNVMFLFPNHIKKKDTIGIEIEEFSKDSEYVCRLKAQLDKNNYIEGYLDKRKDKWQIKFDQSFGVAKINVKLNGYVTDGRFVLAVKSLLDEAKERHGYVEDEFSFIKQLKRSLIKFNPHMTKDKKSLIVDAPITNNPLDKPRYNKGLEKLKLPNLESMDFNDLKKYIKENNIIIRDINSYENNEFSLRKELRRIIRETNSERSYRRQLIDIDEKRKRNINNANLLRTLKEDGWKISGPDIEIMRRGTGKRKAYLHRGTSQILLTEEGGTIRQTIITPISLAESMVIQKYFKNPTYSQIKRVLDFREQVL